MTSTGRRSSCILSFVVSALSVPFILVSAAMAEDLEMINRPVNSSGMTGLLFTTAPFTLDPKTVEVAVAAFSESSTIPNYTISELPALSITVGVSPGMELALKGSYFNETVGGGSNKLRGSGDAELTCKWNFLPQSEASSYPAIALLVAGIAPTSNKNLNLGGVSHWGAKLGLSAGSEILWGEHVLGIYADGQMVVHDLSDDRVRDRYGIANAGFLLPISKYRNLQMLIEYNVVFGVDRIATQGGNYSAVTYGLRLVTEKFNLTIGTQFLRKEETGFENSTRIVGMTSLKF